MQVLVIDPAVQRIDTVDIDDGPDGVRRLIGYDSVDADEIDAGGDHLSFDESCFIRQVPGSGRFRLDSLAPVAGRGVVAGRDPATGTLRTPQLTAEALAQRVRYL